MTDLARAKAFYEAVLGIELREQPAGSNKMGLVSDADGRARCRRHPGARGGVYPDPDGPLVYINVDQIDPTLAQIGDAGGKTLMPRTSIGEHGFVAHFEDTEGNRVALHEAPAA